MMIKVVFAAAAFLMSATASFADGGPWQYLSRVDPMTDSTDYMALSQGEGGEDLRVMCMGNNLLVTVQNERFAFEIDNWLAVTWRVDSNQPIEQSWVNSSGTAVTGKEDAIAVAKAIASAQERFVVQVGSVARVYSVQNASVAVTDVLKGCGVIS